MVFVVAVVATTTNRDHRSTFVLLPCLFVYVKKGGACACVRVKLWEQAILVKTSQVVTDYVGSMIPPEKVERFYTSF